MASPYGASPYARLPTADVDAPVPSASPAPAPAPPAPAAPLPVPTAPAASWGAALARALLSLTGPPPPAPTAAAQSRAFAEALRRRCGEQLVPPLEAGAFEAALQRCARESRPLLVYLHSDLHGDTADFLRLGLCAAATLAALRDGGFLVWAGSVHSADGYSAAAQLQAAGFPFLGVYTGTGSGGGGGAGGGGRYAQVWTHEGMLTADRLAAELRRVAAATRHQLDGVRAQQIARAEDRRLVQEQERSYEQAMQRDVERQQERQQQRRRDEEARVAAAAVEAAAEEAAELSAAIALSKSLEAEGSLDSSRARLAAAPEPEAAPLACVTLRLTLPSGTKVQRRFRPTETLALVRDFVITSAADTGAPLAPGSTFDVASSFPRRVFSAADSASSLSALGLVPTAVLFITLR